MIIKLCVLFSLDHNRIQIADCDIRYLTQTIQYSLITSYFKKQERKTTMKKFKMLAILFALIAAIGMTHLTAGATTYSNSDTDVININNSTSRAAWCYNYISHNTTTRTVTGYDELGYYSTVYSFPMYGYMYTVYGNGSTSDNNTVRITTASQNGYCTERSSNKYNFTQTIPSGKVVHYARIIGAFNETHGSYSKVSGYTDMYFTTLISPVGW